jgi:hypothetical protein
LTTPLCNDIKIACPSKALVRADSPLKPGITTDALFAGGPSPITIIKEGGGYEYEKRGKLDPLV